MYDRPIYLSATDTTLLICGKELPDAVVFKGSEPQMWQSMAQLEHKVMLQTVCCDY